MTIITVAFAHKCIILLFNDNSIYIYAYILENKFLMIINVAFFLFFIVYCYDEESFIYSAIRLCSS